MKRIWFFIISACLVFSSMRSRDTVASQNRAMVHAVGIDSCEEGCSVTLQVFRPDGKGSDTQLDTAQSNVFCISDCGSTVEEAMQRCEDRLGEFLFLGHSQIIVVGDEIALTDPEKLFSYFLRGRETYLGLRLAAAEGKASALLEAELSEGAVAAENLVDVLDRHYKNSAAPKCTLLSLLDCPELSCAVLPIAKIEHSPDKDKNEASGDTVSVPGAAVCKKGERLFTLGPKQCAALNCLRCERQTELLPLQGKSGEVSVYVRHEGSVLSLKQEKGRLLCRYEIEIVVPPDSTADAEFSHPELEDLAAKEIEKECRSLVSLSYEKHRADILGISQQVRQSLPSLWDECDQDPDTLAALCDFEFEITCDAR